MKKGWRIILGIVLAAVLFGGLGADSDRIILNLDEHYQLMTYINTYTAYVTNLFQKLTHLF